MRHFAGMALFAYVLVTDWISNMLSILSNLALCWNLNKTQPHCRTLHFLHLCVVPISIVQLRNEMSVITATATSLKCNTMNCSAMQWTFVELSTDIRRQIHKHTHVLKNMHKLHLDIFCNEIKQKAKNVEYSQKI